MRKVVIGLAGICLAALAGGCDPEGTRLAIGESGPPPLPAHVAGTVSQYATLLGGAEMPVRGYGVVVGLGQNGSAEVPPHLIEELRQYLLRQDLGSWLKGLSDLTPSRFLRDLGTAVVLVEAVIPPGAPVGERLDVGVSALPQSQTRSLEGGTLMPLDLRLVLRGLGSADRSSKIWARAAGPVFVNPFLDESKAADVAKFKVGRVIGGGRVSRSRPILLQLREPDYARATLIERRINERFPSLRKVAVAKNPATIALHVPQDWRGDYKHFLCLVRRLPVRTGPGVGEAHARDIAAAIVQPDANHEELALVWEAIGRQVISVLRTLYASRSPRPAYYAARTGLRLGDGVAEPVLLRFAGSANSPLQIPAVRELGRHPKVVRAAAMLYRLLDDESELVRVAAYEALLKRGDSSRITRYSVSGQFLLDVVRSQRSYVIYARQSGQPRLVLFGKDMAVSRPVFFSSPDEMVTLNAKPGSKHLMIYRKTPRSGEMSETLRIGFLVRTLVQKMGSLPELDKEGKPKGLALTYSQVIRVLNRLCERRDIPARFVLQSTEQVERVYRGTVAAGRPDMPES